MKQEIDVYDTPSGMGGIFEVSIIRDLGDGFVTVRVWYGQATETRWVPWDWDGYRFDVSRDKLTNPHKLTTRL